MIQYFTYCECVFKKEQSTSLSNSHVEGEQEFCNDFPNISKDNSMETEIENRKFPLYTQKARKIELIIIGSCINTG